MTQTRTTSAIAIASDHAGYELKTTLCAWLRDRGDEVLDLGPDSADPVDYPDFGYRISDAMAAGAARLGIAICGSGIGIAIAINRHPQARCALVSDSLSARLARTHNDANVIALGARLIGIETAKDCVDVFLTAQFLGDRHTYRVEKLGQPKFEKDPA